jgi:membrane protein DedA with SNARE-associated domain
MRRIVSPKRVRRASAVFEKWGGAATIFSRFILGTRTALLVASGLLRYPVQKFLAVTFLGALGWLLLVYALFDFLGVAATAVFGFRWITALTAVLFGGTGAAFLTAKSRNRVTDLKNSKSKDIDGEGVDGTPSRKCRGETAD